jgi:saccharopine dehydrogenase-like NADP-dependent oxidoreductase
VKNISRTYASFRILVWRIEINYMGMDIVPLQFLKAVLPNPGDLGENYTGMTSIGCRIKGIKDGKAVLLHLEQL